MFFILLNFFKQKIHVFGIIFVFFFLILIYLFLFFLLFITSFFRFNIFNILNWSVFLFYHTFHYRFILFSFALICSIFLTFFINLLHFFSLWITSCSCRWLRLWKQRICCIKMIFITRWFGVLFNFHHIINLLFLLFF